MGRRKIDIAYLTDDRVRKVTFCKRKGGLFKKADDLSKLCGVEVAVVIIGDKKTCEYASTDMNRILERYQSMQAGVVRDDTSEIARLWTQLETQRREMEALTRELNHEKRQVEELRGASLMALAGMEAAETNGQQMTLPLKANTTAQGIMAPPIFAAPKMPMMPHMGAALPVPMQVPMTMPMPSVLQSQGIAMPNISNNIASPASSKHERDEGHASDMSDDTAEVDSNSEGTAGEEPQLKRQRVDEGAEAVAAAVAALPVQMPLSVPVGTPPVAKMPAVPATTLPAVVPPAVNPAAVSMPVPVPVPVVD